MKTIFRNISLFAVGVTTFLYGANAPFELPSSVPLDVHEIKDNQAGFGYFQFSAELELEDEYYGDKIGDVDFESKGFIYTKAGDKKNGILGKEFEFSYTFGQIKGELKDKTFSNDGKNYINTFEKDGFYVGFRPAYSKNLITNNSFVVNASSSIHTFFYNLQGDFSVTHDGGGNNNYSYDETNYGFATKPAIALQGTYYPTKAIGISAFAGVSTLIVLDVCDYQNKNSSYDADTELSVIASDISSMFGYDLSYKFSNDATINLSSVLSNSSTKKSNETILRYVHTF